MTSIPLSFVVALSLACTGGDPSMEDVFTKAAVGAWDGFAACAEVVGGCVNAYDELDPSWSGVGAGARHARVVHGANLLCPLRGVHQRMCAAQERVETLRAQLEVTSAEATACLTTCPNGDVEAAKTWVGSWRGTRLSGP